MREQLLTEEERKIDYSQLLFKTPAEPDPYEVLGCSQGATDDELRRAYREKAKQLHPDVLRAQGLSDELISRASEQMARLNAAWATLRQKRRL